MGADQGVIVLETGFDPAANEAWVVAGVSDKTMAAATAVHDMMTNPGAGTAPASTSGNTLPAAPSLPPQVRKSGSDF